MNVMLSPRRMLIGGELVESQSGEWLESVNPANEEPIGKVPLGAAADVHRAVAAAESAAPAWDAAGVKERARHLRKLGQALTARAKEILAVEVADTGNTITKLSGDVAAAVEALEHFAGLGLEIKGETIPASPQNLHLTIRQPYGVVGRIAPFNHPIMFAAGGLAAPLMAGNTVVVKPPEQSPLSATILSEICAEVFPKGVVNIVTGYGADAGDALVRHPSVKRIAFIGSVPTGRAIQRAAAETGVKHVSLELGGKNPMIIFPDVDLDEAVKAAIGGMNFAWQGQSCGSTSRLLLHESLYDKFLDKLVAQIAGLRIGDPASAASQMGPVNSKAHYQRVAPLHRGRQSGRRDTRDRRQAAARRRLCARLLDRADRLRQRHARHAHRPGRDFRPGALGAALEHVRGGDRDRQRHRIRPHRVDLDARHQAGAARRQGGQFRLYLDQRFLRALSRHAVRRLEEQRHRSRGRSRRPSELY